MKCLEIPKPLQLISMVIICAACAQMTKSCTNQKSIFIPEVVLLLRTRAQVRFYCNESLHNFVSYHRVHLYSSICTLIVPDSQDPPLPLINNIFYTLHFCTSRCYVCWKTCMVETSVYGLDPDTICCVELYLDQFSEISSRTMKQLD